MEPICFKHQKSSAYKKNTKDNILQSLRRLLQILLESNFCCQRWNPIIFQNYYFIILKKYYPKNQNNILHSSKFSSRYV